MRTLRVIGPLLFWLALFGPLTRGVWAQGDLPSDTSTPQRGVSPTGVRLSGARRSDASLWIGEKQRFQVTLDVSPGVQLKGLALVVDHPRSGPTRHEVGPAGLTEAQTTGTAPIEWVIPFNTDGVYTAYFEADAVGDPNPVREPQIGALSFRVKNWWMWFTAALVGTLVLAGITRFVVSPAFAKLRPRRQISAVRASFAFLLCGAWLIWMVFFNPLSLSVLMAWGGAALFLVAVLVALMV
jgi:hypothetical protein